MRDAGVVDKNMNRSAAADLAEDILNLRLLRNITEMPLRSASLLANRRDGLLSSRLIYFENVKRGSGFGKAMGDSQSNPAGAAGNDSYFSVQAKSSRVCSV
jgi:hypothetical protein